MESENESGQLGDGSQPLDESWWAAVLQQEEEHSLPTRGRADGFSGDRPGPQSSPEDWNWARQLYEADDTVDLNVIGFNRGGLLVEARGLRGFIPISHLIDIQPAPEGADRSGALSAMVGRKLCLKVIEFDPERGRLVFSQRAAQAGPGRRAELLSNLQPGSRVRGDVTNITRFGVFVDLGGLEGLIHVSELSWGRVRHPADVVSCGQSLEVQVLSVDRDQARVALSLKELLPDPWATVDERFSVGQIVEGVVTNVVRFGAFVGIEEGLEGLIHVTELGDGSFLHPRSVVREGERIRARVVNIVGRDRRLGLSLRQVPQQDEPVNPAPESAEEREPLPTI
jgi:small subunit ribosomal protein S1